ncbi:MAG: phosphatase PAP2 family protein [Frankiaceae bacterium]
MTRSGDPAALRRRLHDYDVAMFRRLAAWHPPLLDRILPPLTEAASYSRLWMGIAGALSLKPGAARRAAVHGMAGIALASPIANLVGKLTFSRDRPYAHPVPLIRRAARRPGSSSFPSGHSASAAAFATGVCLEAPALAAPVGVLAGMVCLSRVYTGVHYPLDVVAGIGLGVACGLAATPLVRAVDRAVCMA